MHCKCRADKFKVHKSMTWRSSSKRQVICKSSISKCSEIRAIAPDFAANTGQNGGKSLPQSNSADV